MASNQKPKSPSAKESPAEPFKRAVAGCLRAIAKKPGVDVSFAAERPGLAGMQGAAAGAGAQADASKRPRSCAAMPTPWRCGSPVTIPRVHRRIQPGGQHARAVFEAVEQARVEAIGARRMEGVANNLSAMLDDRFHRAQIRRGHRPRRCAARGCARHAGARTADRPAPPAGGQASGRSLAAADRGPRRQESRPAGAAGRRPAPLRRRHPRSARQPRHGRGPHRKRRRRGRGQRRAAQQEGRQRARTARTRNQTKPSACAPRRPNPPAKICRRKPPKARKLPPPT